MQGPYNRKQLENIVQKVNWIMRSWYMLIARSHGVGQLSFGSANIKGCSMKGTERNHRRSSRLRLGPGRMSPIAKYSRSLAEWQKCLYNMYSIHKKEPCGNLHAACECLLMTEAYKLLVDRWWGRWSGWSVETEKWWKYDRKWSPGATMLMNRIFNHIMDWIQRKPMEILYRQSSWSKDFNSPQSKFHIITSDFQENVSPNITSISRAQCRPRTCFARSLLSQTWNLLFRVDGTQKFASSISDSPGIPFLRSQVINLASFSAETMVKPSAFCPSETVRSHSFIQLSGAHRFWVSSSYTKCSFTLKFPWDVQRGVQSVLYNESNIECTWMYWCCEKGGLLISTS